MKCSKFIFLLAAKNNNHENFEWLKQMLMAWKWFKVKSGQHEQDFDGLVSWLYAPNPSPEKDQKQRSPSTVENDSKRRKDKEGTRQQWRA